MCGIVGLYYKNPALEENLGAMLGAMLTEMTERGPDSTGVAFYRAAADPGAVKITLRAPPHTDWATVAETLCTHFGAAATLTPRATYAVVVLPAAALAHGGADAAADRSADEARAAAWIAEHIEGAQITSMGSAIEIYKAKGLPREVIAHFAVAEMGGSHALGHTRMATESAVTTAHSHPFSTGRDLCLVHNGSLSNHNRWRMRLRDRGIHFRTDNDSEVAAGYLTWRLSEGATLQEAMEAALIDLDGFYTFAVGSRDGFAVLRDPIACKPAILAETDDWVAMASEYRAIARLPGSAAATIWEPQPATVYRWERGSQ